MKTGLFRFWAISARRANIPTRDLDWLWGHHSSSDGTHAEQILTLRFTSAQLQLLLPHSLTALFWLHPQHFNTVYKVNLYWKITLNNINVAPYFWLPREHLLVASLAASAHFSDLHMIRIILYLRKIRNKTKWFEAKMQSFSFVLSLGKSSGNGCREASQVSATLSLFLGEDIPRFSFLFSFLDSGVLGRRSMRYRISGARLSRLCPRSKIYRTHPTDRQSPTVSRCRKWRRKPSL